MDEPRIVYQAPSFLILYKPPFMHSVPLASGEKTLFHWCLERFPELGRVRGKTAGDGGILHRLDRETSGLVLAARTQEAFENLKRQQEDDRIVKSYGALLAPSFSALPGFPPLPPGLGGTFPPEGPLCVESAFRAYGPGRKAVRPVTVPFDAGRPGAGKNRVYRTILLEAKAADEKEYIYAELSLTRGFRHQIRCHMAWLGFPIAGDTVYGGCGSGGPGDGVGDSSGGPGRPPLALKAQGLSFLDPESGSPLSFSLPPLPPTWTRSS
ncbi:MAG: RNA pseudouridine synthase [Spirochaetaceae bacterium]|jgi:23S rRNA pseudouridine1911/1915/1917 synthase|nr:RNA pseudouridine synthase [Spirochaetaceae bacterium]